MDDYLIFAQEKRLVDKLIQELQSNFTLTKEDEVSSYLGVKLEVDNDSGKVSMSLQPFLVDKIIQQHGDAVKDANSNDAPSIFKRFYIRIVMGQQESKA